MLLVLGGCLGFAFGVTTFYFRMFPYDLLREFSESVRFKEPKKASANERVTLFLIGDSLVRRGDWRFLRKKFQTVNLGVGGADVAETTELVKRYSWIREGKALVLIGINDLGNESNPLETAAEIKTLVAELKTRKTEVLVIGLPRFEKHAETGWRAATTKVLNDQLDEAFGVGYLDPNEIWEKSDPKQRLTTDGTHLTGEAYRLLKDAILNALATGEKN